MAFDMLRRYLVVLEVVSDQVEVDFTPLFELVQQLRLLLHLPKNLVNYKK